MIQSSAQTDLKEAKQVMEDEGGANQASLKQQELERAQSHEASNKQDAREQSDNNENECGCAPVSS
jgi:hypothetical protein